MATKKQSTEVVDPNVEIPDFMQEMDDSLYGAGNSTDAGDNTLPFLAVAQPLSPQVNSRKPEYIEGLEVGDLFNTATGRFWKGESEGLSVLPIHYQKNYVEWIPRDEGGGYVATHPFSPRTVAELGAVKRTDGKQGLVIPDNGHHLVETAYTFVQIEDSAMPLVIGASSTALGAMRDWMSARNEMMINGRRAPSFAFWWRMKTVYKENDQGSWYLPRFILLGPVRDKNVFDRAIEFNKMAQKGALTIGRPDEANGTDSDGDIPF